MTRFFLTAIAQSDIRGAKRYYERKRLGLGKDFLDRVWQRIERILAHPRAAPIVEAGIRKAKISKFKFHLYYYIEGDAIVIFTVLHQRRRPDFWKKRL